MVMRATVVRGPAKAGEERLVVTATPGGVSVSFRCGRCDRVRAIREGEPLQRCVCNQVVKTQKLVDLAYQIMLELNDSIEFMGVTPSQVAEAEARDAAWAEESASRELEENSFNTPEEFAEEQAPEDLEAEAYESPADGIEATADSLEDGPEGPENES